MSMGFMDILTAGPQTRPAYAEGAIGTSFHTPEQAAFKAARKKYGTIDDPDAGGYSLAQIDWDKDTGMCETGGLDATNGGWYGHAM
jgi:hypothetical protein